MSLPLDARQRAMLQEMGITVWSDGGATAREAATAATGVPAATAGRGPAEPGMRSAAPVAVAVADTVTPHQPPAAEPHPARPGAPAQSPAMQAPLGANGNALVLHPPRLLYPAADPAAVPAGLGSGWLIVTECPTPTDPLAGDTGRLLDNMLRAMQLHRHPRVFLTAVERNGAALAAIDDTPGALDATVADLQPAMVLVLGHVAARAALARSEPLGRLRAGPHQIAGFPAVVTYDAAFLLRSQDNKAAAWADLCRALAIVRA
ncbi:uracil-DNA glycosylase family protein [Acidovorax sp. RAC01]|uniref:uracil-DNA glycosylase family protein n=1 Tax=Acidovorax sp. RAC01 TaxID=1842533 RepID=UPI00083E7AC3|nr:uracil-DNA glycosylase family protein [Acidovorax sp. RAC01]AOG21774.1 uracil DNA glycosylase superfamily protein [Acidovorax sp. RAC01]